jgi:hypothetical protein
MTLPFSPLKPESIKARLPAALKTNFEFKAPFFPPMPPVAERPEHVFDFEDGVRMIVTRESNLIPSKVQIHFAFGISPGKVGSWVGKDFIKRVREILIDFGHPAKPPGRVETAETYDVWYEYAPV